MQTYSSAIPVDSAYGNSLPYFINLPNLLLLVGLTILLLGIITLK